MDKLGSMQRSKGLGGRTSPATRVDGNAGEVERPHHPHTGISGIGPSGPWKDLAERAAEPNPFYEADCAIPGVAPLPHWGRQNLAVAEHDGRFLPGCVPSWAVHRWKFPYPVVTTQVRRMGYLGTPLLGILTGNEGGWNSS